MFAYGDNLQGEDLAKTLDEMRQNNRFRQVFFLEDTCYGESMGEYISSPGVLYLTASSKNESAFGSNYDPDTDAWLSEEFSYTVLKIISGYPTLSLEKLYTSSYDLVHGSHVRLLNYQTFGDIQNVPVKQFIAP